MRKKIKVALIANTGMGNEVLTALINNPFVIVDSVLTRSLEGEFPYYKELELHNLAKQSGIKCFVNLDVNVEYFDYVKERNIDLIVVATFSQIIKDHLINLPKLGIINFHPSLLPKYKGATPMNWVILNGEKTTGLSVHFLTAELDSGPILLREIIEVDKNETIGSLFKKTSIIAGKVTTRVINSFLNGYIKTIEQDPDESTYFPNAKNKRFRKIISTTNYDSAIKILRAFHPFPKAIIAHNDNEYLVENFILDEKNECNGLNNKNFINITVDGKKVPVIIKEKESV